MKYLYFFLFSLLYCIALPNTAAGAIIFVDAAADDACNDGTSWSCAFTNLHSAFTTAQLNDSIWIAAGVYLPTDIDDRTVSFELPDGVTVLGGFNGTETTVNQRDWENNLTILSGDIGEPDVLSGNSYHVVRAQNLLNGSSIDGVTIEKGSAYIYPIPDDDRIYGGGIYHYADTLVNESHLMIKNCRFYLNNAQLGCALATIGGKGTISTQAKHCVFIDNRGGAAVSYTEANYEETHALITFDSCQMLDQNVPNLTNNAARIIENIAHKGRIDCDIAHTLLDDNNGRINNILDTATIHLNLNNCQILNTQSEILRNENRYGNCQIYLDSCEIAYSQDKCFDIRNFAAKEMDFKITNTEFHHNTGLLVDYTLSDVFGTIPQEIDTFSFTIKNCKIFDNIFDEDDRYINCIIKGEVAEYRFENTEFIGNEFTENNNRTLYFIQQSNHSKFIFNEVTISENLLNTTPFLQIIRSDDNIDSVVLNRCRFEDNDIVLPLSIESGASLIGIGRFNNTNPSSKNLILSNSVFKNNHNVGEIISHCAFTVGTIDDIGVSNNIFSNNLFENNSTEGSVLNFKSSAIDISNCLFANNVGTNNQSNSYGGGIHADTSTIILNNCTFYGNSDNNGSGAIYDKRSRITANNSIFWNNSGMIRIAENINFSPNIFANSLIELSNCNGTSSNTFNTTCPNSLFNTDPLFTNPDTADFTLQPCSPAINFGLNSFLDSLDIPTDLAGNPRIQSLTVDAGALESSIEMAVEVDSLRPFMCADTTQGMVLFSISEGCAPYTLAWASDTLTGLQANNLAAGDYEFTITDARGNFAVRSVNIPAIPDFTLTIQQVDFDCNTGIGGSIFVSPSNPQLNYTYLWNTQDTGFIIGNLLPDTYSVTVTDEQGCSQERAIDINTTGNLALSVTASPISCHDIANGTISVAPLNGQTPYQYVWTTGETDSLLMNLMGGDYEVTVTDALGCTDVLSASISTPEPLLLEAIVTNVQCADADNGTITVSATGGSTMYDYLWNTTQTTSTIDDLGPGNYTVTVTDEKECQDSLTVIITEPLPLSVSTQIESPDCFDAPNGTVSVQPSGGTAPFQYLWNTGNLDSVVTNLAAAIYTVTVTDAQNCIIADTLTLPNPPPFVFSEVIENATTSSSEDGSILLENIDGGVPPYFLQWSNDETGNFIEELLPANYAVTITDNLGCMQTFEFTVSFMSSLNSGLANLLKVNVFPNPLTAQEELSISLEMPQTKIAQFKIYNTIGQILSDTKIMLPSGEQVISLKMPDAPGAYFIEIEIASEEVGIWKIVKIE